MSFQAYLTTIETKTGKTPADFRIYAADKGWMQGGMLRPEVKAGAIVADLKEQFGLGHGHAMALYALFKGKKKDGDA